MTPLEITMAVVFALAGGAWLGVSALALLGIRGMPALGAAPRRDAAHQPSVSIVLAARDEAARIETTVRRALAQRGVRAQVVAVNDRSADDTPAILDALARDDARLVVEHIENLPDGWLGKSHALHRGAARATGEWLLFIDADTWLAPDAASIGVALAQRDDAGHVCFAPAMATSTLPGRATLLAAMLLFAGRAFTVHSRRIGGYMGVGAYNLVRTEAYRAAGGHAALRMDILDDVKLALLVNRAGARTRTAFAPDLVEVEWAGSARGFVALLRKNAFASQDYSVVRTALLAVLGAVLLLLPLGALAAMALSESAIVVACAGVSVAGYLSTLLPGAIIATRFGWSAASVALCLFGHWVVLAAGVNSAVRTLRAGGVRWRETFYPLDELRRGLVR